MKTNQSVIEGTLSQVSKLPPPQNNPYPDCYYTATINIAQIISGQSIPRKVVLVLPGFFGRRYAPEAHFKTGDKVRATVIPFASMSDQVRQTQQSDEIEDVNLDFYYPENIAVLSEFQKVKIPILFPDREQKKEAPVFFQPIDLNAREMRKATMQRDLGQINKVLVEHGGDWDKWYDSLEDFRAKYKKQSDAKAQLWVGDSFFSAGKLDSGKVYSPEFIKSIIAFKNYLDVRNVDLILVRVPNKGEVVDDLFVPVPPNQISNPYLLRMYKELLEADVEIITDIIPRIKEKRLEYPLMYWYQDFSEIHPADGTSFVIAEEFAKRISRYNRVKSIPKQTFTLSKKSSVGDWLKLKWPSGNPKFSSNDYINYTTVLDDKGATVNLKQGLDSPILVVGSSFIATPSLAKGGSIPHYLTYLTGILPDIIYRSGADGTIPRTIAREGDAFLQNRSVVLYPLVPLTTYNKLASPPIFDPDKSTKKLLASYSDKSLHEAIEFYPDNVEEAFYYSPDGRLNIRAVKKDHGAEGIFRAKLPDTVSVFPFFYVDIEFTSNDFSRVISTYSGQTDSTIRSQTQLNNHEVFAFSTKSPKFVEFKFLGSNVSISNIAIKSIRIFGVEKPSYYRKLASQP